MAKKTKKAKTKASKTKITDNNEDWIDDAMEVLEEEKTPANLEDVQTPEELVQVGLPKAVDQITRPNEVYLMQPMSKEQTDSEGEKVEPGYFYNPSTGEAQEKLEVVILGFALERIKFVDPEESSEIECRSRDSIQGTQYGQCSKCEFSKWKDGNPPPCQQFFRFVCIGEDGNPFMLRAKGTSFTPARGYINGLLGQRLPMFSVITEISAEKIEKKKRKYYKLEFNRGPERSLEQMKQAAELSRRIMGLKSPYNEDEFTGDAEVAKKPSDT